MIWYWVTATICHIQPEDGLLQIVAILTRSCTPKQPWPPPPPPPNHQSILIYHHLHHQWRVRHTIWGHISKGHSLIPLINKSKCVDYSLFLAFPYLRVTLRLFSYFYSYVFYWLFYFPLCFLNFVPSFLVLYCFLLFYHSCLYILPFSSLIPSILLVISFSCFYI